MAAYRFGHSMTRPRYTVRDVFPPTGTTHGSVSGVPLFEDQPTDNNLNGHRQLLPRLKIQWSKFFNAGTEAHCSARAPVRCFAGRPTVQDALDGAARHQPSRSAVPAEPPPGQEDGPALGTAGGATDGRDAPHSHPVVTDRSIKVKIPIASSNMVEAPQARRRWRTRTSRTLFADPEWPGETPLWFYILKEAEIVGKGRTLGPVGGRIVAEVLVGLLQKDLNSYLYLQPTWKPAPPIAPARGQFTMADLLKFAGVWS